MTDRAALLAAVLADPADDTARLVYADCLEETGVAKHVARAAFIRAQVELATLAAVPGEVTRRAELDTQIAALLKTWGAGWLPRPLRVLIPPTVTGATVYSHALRGYVHFHRGFISQVGIALPWRPDEASAAVARFAAHVRALFATHPLEAAVLSFDAVEGVELTAEIRYDPVRADLPDLKCWRVGWDMATFERNPLDVITSPMVCLSRSDLHRLLPTWLGEAMERPTQHAYNLMAQLMAQQQQEEAMWPTQEEIDEYHEEMGRGIPPLSEYEA